MNSCLRFGVFVSLVVLSATSFSQNSLRIVSLAPSLTKMIYILEAQKELVGCTNYCEIDKNDKVEVVASAIEVSTEKVFMMKPDLVVTTTMTKPSTIEALRKLGIKVVAFSTPKSFDGICDALTQLADLIGKQDKANEIVSKQRERLATLKSSIKNAAKERYFFQIGAKPLFAVIPNTFMDEYITILGGENIAQDMTSGSITRESVLVKNPDVIVVVTMGIIGDEEKATWASYPQLNAAKKGKIFIIDSYKACSPTPINFVDTVELLVSMIHN